MITYKLMAHQDASLNGILRYPEIPYIFLIGGFGCGKSFTVGQLCLFLYSVYKDVPVTVGLFGVTIKLLKQTVLATLRRFLDEAGIPYRDNSLSSTLQVGKVTFIYLAMKDPEEIYAYNFSCAFVDEIDEVDSSRIPMIVTAIQERCRVPLPKVSAGAPRYASALSGRSPFIFFSTTAQGMKGVYAFMRTLDERGVPYMKIRGRTEDNGALDPMQVKLLRALYTEDEARAYLEGEFVNLSEGRVYPEFSRAKCALAPFPVLPPSGKSGGDVLYCGQDFNLGFNACVVVVVRGDVLYVVAEHSWEYLGAAPAMLRLKYPESKIVFIPDASGKEIMSGFLDEFGRHGIELFWNSANPSISERVAMVNRLFHAGKLFVFSGCKHLLTSLEVRDYDKMGVPRKGVGRGAPDHVCDALEYAVWRVVQERRSLDEFFNYERKGVKRWA